MDRRRMESLRSVSDSKKKAEEEASRALREIRGRIDQAEDTLNQLEAYRDEYRNQMVSENRVPAATLVRKRRFVCDIETTIDAQRKKLAELTGEFGEHMHRWRECRAQSMGLDRLIASHEARLLGLENKREQTESDDRVGHRSSLKFDSTP